MARYGDSTFRGNENSGRRTDAEIVKHYADLDLANGIYNKEIKNLSEKEERTLEEMKALIMPVVVKGIRTDVDITTQGEKINIMNYEQAVSIIREGEASSEDDSAKQPDSI